MGVAALLPAIGGIIGGGGAIAAGATAATAIGAASLGMAAGQMISGSRGRQGRTPNFAPPPPVADKFPVPNFMEIMDQISGEKATFISGVDGKKYIEFTDTKGRIQLDAPIQANLAQVNPIVGRDVDLRKTAALTVLSEKMATLSDTIDRIAATDPFLIQQNQPFLQAFRKAQDTYLRRGFDLKQQGLHVRLAKMGMNLSSTALGAEIALTREAVQQRQSADLEYAELALKGKQSLLQAYGSAGEQLARTGQYEGNLYQTQTQNALTLRDQDIRAQAMTEELRQKRDQAQAALNMEAELNRRKLIIGRNFPQNAMNLYQSATGQALTAFQQDSTNMVNTNTLNLDAYKTKTPSLGESLLTGIATNAAGTIGGNLGNRWFPMEVKKQKA